MTEVVGLHTRLKPGAEAEFEALHRHVWPDVLAAIRRAGIERWLIFRDGLDQWKHFESWLAPLRAALGDSPTRYR